MTSRQLTKKIFFPKRSKAQDEQNLHCREDDDVQDPMTQKQMNIRCKKYEPRDAANSTRIYIIKSHLFAECRLKVMCIVVKAKILLRQATYH